MKLIGRAQLLQAMGVLGPEEKTWRAAWSHDDGKYIYFDAWTNRYVEGGYPKQIAEDPVDVGLFPMCTDKEYMRPNKDGLVRHTDRENGETTPWMPPLMGHTRWLHHLDLTRHTLLR